MPNRNRLSARGRLLLSAGLILAAIAAQFVILTFFPGSPHSQRVLLGHPPLLAATELGITICWALLMTILDGPQESLRRLFATAFSYVSLLLAVAMQNAPMAGFWDAFLQRFLVAAMVGGPFALVVWGIQTA